ncbi:putative monooxygenase [Cadophora sp. DSE1049]|nr:putative monooxygenase [Cadophora sp. DSE1049]
MGSTSIHDDLSYVIDEKALGTPRPVKVICIGAGTSGMNTAYQMQTHMKAFELVIYEKNNAIGGTWLENTYPGVACDIPAHNYQFSWAPNPDWSEFYVSGPEILQYFQKTAASFGMEKYLKLQHQITGAFWEEESSTWRVEVQNQVTGEKIEDRCDFLINGTGFLNNWKWPDIRGLHSFKGDLLHTASWQTSANLKDKRVAVIGNGSLGMQIVTAIYPDVKHLTTFIRNPTWVSTSFALQYAGPNGSSFKYTDEQKKEFKEDPEKFAKYRKALDEEMSGRFDLMHKDSELQGQARAYLTSVMRSRLGEDHPLVDKIIPNFGVGCRRSTPGLGYLETLAKQNVRLIDDGIAEVLPSGIKLNTGEFIEIDTLICATGFDVSWKPRFPIVGRNGVNLRETWEGRPTGYLGLAVPDIPNYFLYMGPNSPLGHGSAIPAIEHVTKYICRMIYKAQTECYKSMAPSRKAVEEYIQHADLYHERTVWSGNCVSWFKGGKDGPVIALTPGSRLHWFHLLKEPRFEDWEWRTSGSNRFAYLGNGYSTMEVEGKDKSWFLNDVNLGYETLIY